MKEILKKKDPGRNVLFLTIEVRRSGERARTRLHTYCTENNLRRQRSYVLHCVSVCVCVCVMVKLRRFQNTRHNGSACSKRLTKASEVERRGHDLDWGLAGNSSICQQRLCYAMNNMRCKVPART